MTGCCLRTPWTTNWAALQWLMENQNKLNPNWHHYPLIPYLSLYSIWIELYYVYLAKLIRSYLIFFFTATRPASLLCKLAIEAESAPASVASNSCWATCEPKWTLSEQPLNFHSKSEFLSRVSQKQSGISPREQFLVRVWVIPAATIAWTNAVSLFVCL